MKILIKDGDPVQIQIDKVQRSIKVYNSYLEWYDDKSSPKAHAELLKKLEKEVGILGRLKSKHPEYFI